MLKYDELCELYPNIETMTAKRREEAVAVDAGFFEELLAEMGDINKHARFRKIVILRADIECEAAELEAFGAALADKDWRMAEEKEEKRLVIVRELVEAEAEEEEEADYMFDVEPVTGAESMDSDSEEKDKDKESIKAKAAQKRPKRKRKPHKRSKSVKLVKMEEVARKKRSKKKKKKKFKPHKRSKSRKDLKLESLVDELDDEHGDEPTMKRAKSSKKRKRKRKPHKRSKSTRTTIKIEQGIDDASSESDEI